MKNLCFYCLLLVGMGFYSCKKNQNENVIKTNDTQPQKPMDIQCYKAYYEQDTVDLKINTLKNGKVTGDMVMKFFKMPVKIGKIAGEFHGDTLLTSYTFIQGTDKKITFKNPMAFLKRGEQLILGNGKMQTTMGATYFVKDEPIDFERVKFKFSAVPCVAEKAAAVSE